MTQFTVFCQQTNGEGTVWINNVEASNIAYAKERAIAKCSFDWNCDPTLIRVLGVAAGKVEILEWEDLVDEITGFEGYGT